MQTLIVTGGSSGIGKAVLDRLRSQFEAGKVLNIDVHADTPIDVRDYSQTYKALENHIQPECTNYLFAAAGVAFFLDPQTDEPVDFATAPIEQLQEMVDINLKGQINILHAFIRLVKMRKATGNIILVSSISAFYSGGPNMAVYDATKAAISALGQRLLPYQPQITINTIEPGSVRTNIGSWKVDLTENKRGYKLVQHSQDHDARQLGREVTTENIANVAEFLFFKDHGLNGARIVVDGGLTLLGRTSFDDK